MAKGSPDATVRLSLTALTGPSSLVSLLKKILVPTLLLGGCCAIGWHLGHQAPTPEESRRPTPAIPITAATVQPQDYTVVLSSRGEVRARTASSLVAEVAGVVMDIAPAFRDGGFFEQGDLLVQLDDRDYKAAVVIARSAVAQAETAVSEEQARAAQALEDWKALGRPGEPGPLVSRQPQLAEAAARLESAKASEQRALRDLERCSIRAPYAGRVLQKNVDVGQFVTAGRELARIYAIDSAEIDLPLSSEQLAFVDLPERYRGDAAIDEANGPEVVLRSDFGGRPGEWRGRIVRAAGSIDVGSRQLFVTAQVQDPYARRSGDIPPLKVGTWVNAEVTGRTLRNVFVIPRVAVREGNMVLTIDKDQKLRNRRVSIAWGERDHVVVDDGLKPGDVVCTVSMSFAVEGTLVKPRLQPMPPLQIPGRSVLYQTKGPETEAPGEAGKS